MSSETLTIIGTGEPIEGKNIVEFRLLYEGELPSCTNRDRRTKEKHSIRKQLHPQLRRLWTVKAGLRQLAEHKGMLVEHAAVEQASSVSTESGHIVYSPEQSRFDLGIATMGNKWNSAGFDFVPLVTSDFTLRCSLDILLLRPEGSKYIFEQGDIDGQLKTLFDAFRRPCDIGEAGGNTPADDEKPLFCLLQDDKLISEVHIITDQLLLRPHKREIKAIDAFVVIHVRLNHIGGSPFDRWFD